MCCYYRLTVFFFLVITACNQTDKLTLTHLVKLDNYPSASAIESIDGKLYIMGDDAPAILVVDTSFHIIDSIPLIHFAGKRIPKEIKPDLEASAFHRDNRGTVLFLFGSGSLAPYRNTAWWYYLETQIKDSLPVQPLYSRLKTSLADRVNIEGACFIPQYLVLANRGNKSFPENHLILMNENFWNGDTSLPIRLIRVGSNRDTAIFNGISGLCYSEKSDWLILTVSTEDTRSSFEDGAIGKSYLWIIRDVNRKTTLQTLDPDEIIDLEKTDTRFHGQKIESACVTGESDDTIYLALAADNDDGSSTLFRVSLRKN